MEWSDGPHALFRPRAGQRQTLIVLTVPRCNVVNEGNVVFLHFPVSALPKTSLSISAHTRPNR